MRIGQGFDVHAFQEGGTLILGGVRIPYTHSLAAHSDGDVVLHALCDALLGAAALGDIGHHFPDSDEQYRNISSLLLLDEVVQQCAGLQMKLSNADITIVCQSPKLAPYIEQMRQCLAEHCQVRTDQLNIKATTTEKMGYIGRQEGISCHAVALLEK